MCTYDWLCDILYQIFKRYNVLDFIDLQYADKVSVKFDRFSVKKRSPYEANFRCPYCGDSAKSKFKARGWLFEGKTGLRFFCHNCGVSVNFYRFLKDQDMGLYNEFVADKFVESGNSRRAKKQEVFFEKPSVVFGDSSSLKTLTKISDMAESHPARVYLEQVRMLPTLSGIYYSKDFNSWINSIVPDKLPKSKKEPRIVIPFRDENKNVFGVTGRGFDPNGLRYITIMFDDSKPKIYGLDKVDFSKKYYMVEGQFDSMFIKNSVAMAGADGNIAYLKNVENCVTVFDNEPRNREIVARMLKVTKSGRMICIWPDTIKQKDINDMVTMSGINAQKIIDENTYSGLSAELRLAEWRKI